MGILTADMQRVVLEQRLGFHATVGADGTPNPSPYEDRYRAVVLIRVEQTDVL